MGHSSGANEWACPAGFHGRAVLWAELKVASANMGCHGSKSSPPTTADAAKGDASAHDDTTAAVRRDSEQRTIRQMTEAMSQVRYEAKRRVLFSQPTVDGPSISALAGMACPSIAKPAAIKVLLKKALQSHFLFGVSLEPAQFNVMVDAMGPQDVPAGHELITQGEPGQYFYIVERGTFSIAVDGRTVDSDPRAAGRRRAG